MFNFKTILDLGIDFFFVAITIFFIVLPLVTYKQYRKKYDKEKSYCDPSDFYEYIFDDKILMGVSFVAGFIFFILTAGSTAYDAYTIISNRYEEPAIYEQYIEREKVITDCIEISDDIINTDLYNNAIAYNTNLAEIKAKYTDSNFSINFTGDYDWDAIPYISLK